MRTVFHNPKVKDKVTVLKSADETKGEYILVEVELAPRCRNVEAEFNSK